MRSEDLSTARQVWQRVSPPKSEPVLSERETMLQLVRQLLCDRALFLNMAHKSPPAEQVLLYGLAQTYLQEAACLRGVLRLTTGNGVREPADITPTPNLVQCYRHGLLRLNAYALRTADPLCAPAFRQLEQQTRQSCADLLKLMGMADPTPQKRNKGR